MKLYKIQKINIMIKQIKKIINNYKKKCKYQKQKNMKIKKR